MMDAAILNFERRYIPEPNSGCWLWTGAVATKTGYGRFHFTGTKETTMAHRASWRLFRGEINDGLQVCHKCDVRTCVNPDHLFLGTAFDNMRDASEKGRLDWKGEHRNFQVGERHHMTTLTESQVLEIRASAEGPRPIARKYGVTAITIRRIRRRQVWGHI